MPTNPRAQLLFVAALGEHTSNGARTDKSVVYHQVFRCVFGGPCRGCKNNFQERGLICAGLMRLPHHKPRFIIPYLGHTQSITMSCRARDSYNLTLGLILVLVLATNTVLKTPVVDPSRTWLVNKYFGVARIVVLLWGSWKDG
jgi:hypothetical protein